MRLPFVPDNGTFHYMRNAIFPGTVGTNEAALERRLCTVVHNALAHALPPAWSVADARFESVVDPSGGPDAVLVLAGPDQTSARIAVEVKRRVEPRDVPRLFPMHNALTERDGGVLLVAAPFLSSRTRELLAAEGMSYADATGNLRLVVNRPAIFILREGASTDPWRADRPLHSLKGRAAGRVVRGLCDLRPPYGVRALAERTQTAVASVSRVVQLLDREALLTRDPRGAVINVRWPALIRRWSTDYALTTSNTANRLLAPRGFDPLLRALPAVPWRYSLTGSLAAALLAPLAPAKLATIYVEDATVAADHLQLRLVETGTNVLLLEPFDPVVFERTREHAGLIYAAAAQVAADLLTSPGRGPAEGEELLRWMEGHEGAWRA